jgi:hypothetical protein
MKNETKEILAEGLKHFKQASFVWREFVKNTQIELQAYYRKEKVGELYLSPSALLRVQQLRLLASAA